MKTIGVWNRYPELSRNNHLFFHRNAPIGDDLLLPFNRLYIEGRARGVRFVTLDLVNDIDALDGMLFIDMPMDPFGIAAMMHTDQKVPRYLLTFEPAVVCPENWINHQKYQKVFTWNDLLDLCGADPRYVKINYAQEFPKIMPRNPRHRLACMIASNKSSQHPRELYSARRETIEWFEKNAPAALDLYGPGWNSMERPSYRGLCESKRETMLDYRFAIVYENAKYPGYITEKMFDCFIAGTIPVYLGAPNIQFYVPSTCYVDRRGFATHEEMWNFLISMDDHAWRDAIEAFMQSESARPFTIERFVDTILANV